MKKYFICIALILSFVISYEAKGSEHERYSAQKNNEKVSDTLITQLTTLNLSYYNAQPVDSILAHLPAGVVNMKITGWRSIRVAEILHVVYPGNIVVEIHVRNFQYMNPKWVNTSTPKQNWSIPLFRKETIAYTVIFNRSTCINGCENEYK